MKNQTYYVVNRYTGHLMGAVRAASVEVAKQMAHILFGCYTSVEVMK